MTDTSRDKIPAERPAGIPKKEKISSLPIPLEPKHPGKSRWRIWSTEFEIDDRYVPIKAVGKGAYGTVCSAREKATGERVAIKKIANCFDHIVDARRTLRECMLLRHLQHDNVIGLRELMTPSQKDFKDLYIVQDLMDTDLHQIIRSSQPLSNDHLQFFIYQVLRGLKYIHSANVLHRDLKPSNLLLNACCDLKICDFGLARTRAQFKRSDIMQIILLDCNTLEANFMTEYVVTRWYRAPELLLACEFYSGSIDVWSVGCILAELLLRQPFFPGKDYLDQLKIIIAQLGTPSEQEMSFITNEKARAFIRDLGFVPGKSFRRVFPDAHPDALDLLGRMLQFDPRRRITVEDALRHPYVAAIRCDEPCASSPFSFDMESEDLGKDMVKQLVLNEVLYYKAKRATSGSSREQTI